MLELTNRQAVFLGKGFELNVGELAGRKVAEVEIDLKSESVNKLNALMLHELGEVIQHLEKTQGIEGLLISSRKDVFIVGADVTEFFDHFKKTDSELMSWVRNVHQMFSRIEDLPFPTVTAINGFALGGGMELALTTDLRICAQEAKVGLPETKLGIIPGWGGTVRLSRLAGADNAIEWIATGDQWKADVALKVGAVDAVVPLAQLKSGAATLLQSAMAGSVNWKKRRELKKGPLQLSSTEMMMAFEGAKAFIGGKAGPNYPAPVIAIESIQKGALKSREEAMQFEAEAFVKVTKTPTAHALVGLFLGDQAVKKTAKKASAQAKPVKTAAVLGAGIMGGGIAFQSASSKVPIFMKDIQEKALELGMGEAIKNLEKLVSKGKMTPAKMAETLTRIRPSLTYAEFGPVDLVVEAVVENEKIKKSVLAELEGVVRPETIIASNTSTLLISGLASELKRPENFVGMHFFNPVPKMPLVEVIRGKKSSETAVATAVAYALTMGKTPIVVNDCPGFLVNRVLFPYFAGFKSLIREGVSFQKIDQVMEKFGWPMGPAYLLDVVGIDTAFHADSVMAAGFPDRMKEEGTSIIEILFLEKRFGQKNGKGFYQYVPNPKGPPKKELDPTIDASLARVVQAGGSANAISDAEIIERMMLPMITESSRCLEEGIVGSAVEVDISVLYGLGFPPFRGGILRYADSVGLANLVEWGKKYSKLGKLYEPTTQMKKLAQEHRGFYQLGEGK